MSEPIADAPRLESIIADTTDEVFETGGGFGFTDEIALALNKTWRKHGPRVVVSQTDLAWLLDGYARARLAAISASGSAGDDR